MEILHRWAAWAKPIAQRHGRAAAWALAITLGGSTALAVAVAPLAPDAAQLPQREVVEPVRTIDVTDQLEALASTRLELDRSEVARPGDNWPGLLRRLGVMDAAAQRAIQQDAVMRRSLEGRYTRLVTARATPGGELLTLVVRGPAEASELANTHFSRITLTRQEGAWRSQRENVRLGSETRLAGGTIRSSLYAATDEARLPDAVVTQITEIFSGDVDFYRELRKGDTFSLVYETHTADGLPVPWSQGAGRVLAGELVSGGRTHQALWFASDGRRGAYFDPSGRSRKRAFLSSPLEFSRVSSGFAMRMHPIMQTWRQHLGVDYSAPKGTPVRTVGDGVVEMAGWQGGYGNVVHVRHGNNRTTVYAHLSRVDVRKGQRVEQGQRIGLVGSTGWATGPHLHFEFRVGGVHMDPLKVARATESQTLDPAARAAFADVARQARVSLAVASSIGTLRPSFE